MEKKTILFDVDGVLLSEERYFDASALTVWELIHSSQYIGLDKHKFTTNVTDHLVSSIRSSIFQNDSILSFIKSRGINANWDMVYLTTSHFILTVLENIKQVDPPFVTSFLQGDIDRGALQTLQQKALQTNQNISITSFIKDFEQGDAMKGDMLTYLNTIAWNKLGVKTSCFSRNSKLWNICQETFQEWYVGDELIEQSIGRKTKQSGKPGFIQHEIPLAEVQSLKNLFQRFIDEGWIVGVGTGRPRLETIEPLRTIGLLEYIDPHHIVTASEVLEAEASYPDRAPLAKPQPYTYVLSWLGAEGTMDKAIEQALPMSDKHIVIVGDSLADGLAAQTMGVTFAAVLTGLSGQKARSEFEKLPADYIFDNVVDVEAIL